MYKCLHTLYCMYTYTYVYNIIIQYTYVRTTKYSEVLKSLLKQKYYTKQLYMDSITLHHLCGNSQSYQTLSVVMIVLYICYYDCLSIAMIAMSIAPIVLQCLHVITDCTALA